MAEDDVDRRRVGRGMHEAHLRLISLRSRGCVAEQQRVEVTRLTQDRDGIVLAGLQHGEVAL